jgi:hypothetical protein
MNDRALGNILMNCDIEELSAIALDEAFDFALTYWGADTPIFQRIQNERNSRVHGYDAV